MAPAEARSVRVLSKRFVGNTATTNSATPSVKKRVLKIKDSRALRPVERQEKDRKKLASSRMLVEKSNSVKRTKKPVRSVQSFPDPLTEVGKLAQQNKLTHLERKSISSESLSQYGLYLDRFKDFCKQSGVQWPLAAELADGVMADYMDVVCRGPSSTRGRENVGRPGVQLNPSSGKNAAVKKSPQRLEESNAIHKSSSIAKGGNVRHRNVSVRQRTAYDVFDGFGGVLSLSSSRRSVRPSRKACHPSSQTCRETVCHDHGDHQGSRGIEARQSGGVRQLPAVRLSTHSLDRRSTSFESKSTQKQGSENFSFHSRSVSGPIFLGRRSNRIGRASSLSNEAWWSDGRSDGKASRFQWCKNKRQVVHRPKRETIRQGGSCPATHQQTHREQHEILPVVGEEHSESFSWHNSSSNTDKLIEDVFSIDSRPHKFALEVFAGSARITQALQREGLPAYAVDTCIFPSHNVLLPSVENKIKFWIVSQRIFFIWFGMPCTTFSKARKHDGLGPGPLRSSEYLWGLPFLKRRDVAKVEEGNLLLAFLMRMLHLCILHSVPFVVENPLTSMLWDMPPIIQLRDEFHLQIIHLDYCAYGECWKKPTTLMSHGIDLAPLAKRCSTTSKICSFTNRQHLALRGVNADGIFWTLVAQPYPPSLCAELAALARAQLRVVKGS